MEDERLSSEKINEALELLSEAAREKKDEIRGMITDKYSALRDVVGGAGASLADTWSATRQKVADSAKQYKDIGAEKVHTAAVTVDEQVHLNPWPFLGGVALGSLVLGYVMGRSKENRD